MLNYFLFCQHEYSENNFVFLPTDSKKDLLKTIPNKPRNSPKIRRRIQSPDLKTKNFLILKLDKGINFNLICVEKRSAARKWISPTFENQPKLKNRKYIIVDKVVEW